jgi:protease IV
MTADADALVARRRLRRKLSFWRVAAVLLAAIVIVALGVTGARNGGGFAFGDQVARVRIQGFISGDQSTLDLFDAIEKAGRVKGVILHVDSPGGTTVGAEALYEAVRKVAEKKPVVAVMDTVAASGGYATAAAADHIVARGNTITGSIGVIFQWPDVSKLMETVGVKMEEIKSGELKAEPTPFKPPSDKVRAVSMEMVRDSFDWFTGLVAERRRLPLDQVRVLSDGRVYTGRQALRVKLIDDIGGEDKAVLWLTSVRLVPSGLAIVDWEPSSGFEGSVLGMSAAQSILSFLGLGEVARFVDLAIDGSRVRLDGLVSVWHPDAQ